MSMHLEGPWLSTTSTKKRKEKITKSQREELEGNWRDRNQRLKQMGLPKETFEQFLEWVYGRGKKKKKEKDIKTIRTQTNAMLRKSQSSMAPTFGSKKQEKNENDKTDHGPIEPTACSKKPSPTYTGTKVLGIAVLHKSCLQPVFSQEEAIDIAKMRR